MLKSLSYFFTNVKNYTVRYSSGPLLGPWSFRCQLPDNGVCVKSLANITIDVLFAMLIGRGDKLLILFLHSLFFYAAQRFMFVLTK